MLQSETMQSDWIIWTLVKKSVQLIEPVTADISWGKNNIQWKLNNFNGKEINNNQIGMHFSLFLAYIFYVFILMDRNVFVQLKSRK